MSKSEIKMQDILPEDILVLEEMFNKLNELNVIRDGYTFQKIFDITIKNIEKNNIPDDTLNAFFVGKLFESIRWDEIIISSEFLTDIDENMKFKLRIDFANEFILKLINVMIQYGGYRTISKKTNDISVWCFWQYIHWIVPKYFDDFRKNIIAEIDKIKESKNEKKVGDLLKRSIIILEFFLETSVEDYENESIKLLGDVTKKILNLIEQYKFGFDNKILSQKLIYIFYFLEEIEEEEIKNIIIKFLIEHTNYFYRLAISDIDDKDYLDFAEKSDFFRMYLENALLLEKKDLYSGKILEEILRNLFLESKDNNSQDFSDTLLVIEKICNEPINLKMLLDSDFFNKIESIFKYFIFNYYRKKSKSEICKFREKEMKLFYIKIQFYIFIKKKELRRDDKKSQEEQKPKRYFRTRRE